MKKFFLIFGLAIMLSACGSYQHTLQEQDRAYLLIIGDPNGVVVTLDDTASLELGKDTVSFDLNGQTATKIEISIGTHSVHITKNGNLKVHRNFFVSNGNSFEVRL